MLQDMWNLLITRLDFFGGLLLEHIEISLVAIAIAIVFGGIAGILISEYQKAAKPTLAVINFLYTIPSISILSCFDNCCNLPYLLSRIRASARLRAESLRISCSERCSAACAVSR